MLRLGVCVVALRGDVAEGRGPAGPRGPEAPQCTVD